MEASRQQLCKPTRPLCQTAEPQQRQAGQAATRHCYLNDSTIKLTLSWKCSRATRNHPQASDIDLHTCASESTNNPTLASLIQGGDRRHFHSAGEHVSQELIIIRDASVLHQNSCLLTHNGSTGSQFTLLTRPVLCISTTSQASSLSTGI